MKKVTMPYNIPRSGKLATTKNGNPVVSIATLDGRIAIPVAMDGAYQRYRELLEQGYNTTFFRFKFNHRRIHVTPQEGL